MNRILINLNAIISILLHQLTWCGIQKNQVITTLIGLADKQILIDNSSPILQIQYGLFLVDGLDLKRLDGLFKRLFESKTGEDREFGEKVMQLVKNHLGLIRLLEDAGFQNPLPKELRKASDYESLEKYLTCLEEARRHWQGSETLFLSKEINDIKASIHNLLNASISDSIMDLKTIKDYSHSDNAKYSQKLEELAPKWKIMYERLKRSALGDADLVEQLTKDYEYAAANYLFASYLANIEPLAQALRDTFNLIVPNDQKQQQEHLRKIEARFSDLITHHETWCRRVREFEIPFTNKYISGCCNPYAKYAYETQKHIHETKVRYFILWTSKALTQKKSLLELELDKSPEIEDFAADFEEQFQAPDSGSDAEPAQSILSKKQKKNARKAARKRAKRALKGSYSPSIIHPIAELSNPELLGEINEIAAADLHDWEGTELESLCPSSSVSTSATDLATELSNAELINELQEIAPETAQNDIIQYTIGEIREILYKNSVASKCDSKFDEIKSLQNLIDLEDAELEFSCAYSGREDIDHGKGHVKDKIGIASTNNLNNPNTSEIDLITESENVVKRIGLHLLIVNAYKTIADLSAGEKVVQLALDFFDTQIRVGEELQPMRQLFRDYIENKTRRFCERIHATKSRATARQLIEFITKQFLITDPKEQARVKIVCTKNPDTKKIFEGRMQIHSNLSELLKSNQDGAWIGTTAPESWGYGEYHTHNQFYDQIKEVIIKAGKDKRFITSSLPNIEPSILALIPDAVLNASPKHHLRIMCAKQPDGSLIMVSGSNTFSSSALGRTKNKIGNRNGKGRFELEWAVKIMKPSPDIVSKIKSMI